VPTPTADLAARFRAHLASSGLFDPPGRVLLAVSGGADSLALLYLMRAVADAHHLELHVGHVDHGVHAASTAWATHVADIAAGLGLPCHVERLALGPGTTETDARTARYPALRRLQRAAVATYLATAHQASDQVETVLFRFLRGSGPAGLAGIPARGPRGLRRPLLPFTGEALRAWLTATAPDVEPVDDPANADQRHDRNWLRWSLLPEIRRRFPDVERAVRSGAHQAAADRAAWESLVGLDASLGVSRRPGVVEVERGPFARYDNVLSEAILRAVCRMAGWRPRSRRVTALVAFAREAPSGRRLELGEGWTAVTVFGRLRVCAPDASGQAADGTPDAVAWGPAAAGEATWGVWGISWCRGIAERVERRSWTTWVRADRGEVRGARAGDTMCPLGGIGRRPVRRLLMEARVPRAERARHPLIVQDTRVLWVPGVCRGNEAVPRPGEPAVRLDVRRIGDP